MCAYQKAKATKKQAVYGPSTSPSVFLHHGKGLFHLQLHSWCCLVRSCAPDFHVTEFGGSKSLILTTESPVGNKNGVLGGAFMGVGGLCLVAAFVVLTKFQAMPRLVELTPPMQAEVVGR